jgi:hypothetical protein
MGITKRQVDQAFEDFHKTYGGLKEDYFGLLYLANYWDRTPEQVATRVAFGGDDYGVDGFWIDRDARALYLYQFKWTTDPAQFKGSLERFVADGVARIFGDLPPDPKKNPFLIELASRLHECQALIEKVFVYFVFDGDTEAAERSKVLESLREDLESKKHFLDTFFDRNVLGGHPKPASDGHLKTGQSA